MFGRSIALALMLVAGAAVYGQCAVSEAQTALKAMQESMLLDDTRAAQEIVDRWLPTVIARVRAADRDRHWYKVAVVAATELERKYYRPEEARQLRELVAGTDQRIAGMWPKLALQAIQRAERVAAGGSERGR